MTHLHVFAVNEPVTISHTNLTRQKGEAPDLPPLAEWLGVETLDTDRIELFPLSELGGMALSDYIQLAFSPDEATPGDVQGRLDALEGAILLVPDTAMPAQPSPGAQLTSVATIALAQADHVASLPKADTTPAPPAPTPLPAEREGTPPIAFFALLAVVIFAALAIFIGWA